MNPGSLPSSARKAKNSDAIIGMLTAYNDLNNSTIDELTSIPSPLEFMRFVSRNRPFIVRGGASRWPATKTWNIARLQEIMGDAAVEVAVTPKGNADSPVTDEEGNLIFVKPHVEEQKFGDFIDFVTRQEKSGAHKVGQEEVRYAQTQNDNLRNEYAPLFQDVEKDIPWARIALQQQPEAINLWIGNSHSVTALHKDNYENIYVQVLGQKHFVLLPPLAYACVAERELAPASYIRASDGSGRLEISLEEGGQVPFATWDPDGDEVKTIFENYVRPMRFVLNSGDMLYLPALWYHKVSQSCNEEGICCAVNYWHDMDFGGSFYPLCCLAKDVVASNSCG